jgi:hypothetical protein
VTDNGQTVLDMQLRNALKMINANAGKYFKYFDRQIKPTFETLEIDHLNFNSVNPRITKKMHDRGALLELNYFDPGNISVTSRPPKASFSDLMLYLTIPSTATAQASFIKCSQGIFYVFGLINNMNIQLVIVI